MAASTLAALPSGVMIGAYRIEGVLGAGAWAITYSATDRHTRERVALREYFPELLCRRADGGMAVIPASPLDRSDFSAGVTGFMRWARTVATVRHNNIASVRRVLETNGTAYVATVLVEGAPLDALLRPEEPLDPQELEEILPGLFSGLEAIHRAGLYHRAIHPGAIFIRQDAQPVIDLPAADWQIEDPDVELAAHVRAYASPEVLVREDFGPWSDVYSLAATLFRLVTGAPPAAADTRAFPRADRPDTIAHMLEMAGGAWRPQLLEMITRGMALSPKSRPPSIAHMRAGLEQRVIEEPDTVPTRAHRRSHAARTQRFTPPPGAPAPEDDPGAGVGQSVPLGPGPENAGEVPTPNQAGAAPDPFNLPTETSRRRTAPGPAGATPEPGATTTTGMAPDPAADHSLDLDRPTRPAFSQESAGPAQDAEKKDAAPADVNETAPVPGAPPPPLPSRKPPEPPPAHVIYRRGKPAEVPPEEARSARNPARSGASEDAEEKTTANIAPARFTLFHPPEVGPRSWGTLVVYIHESGIASIIARQEADRRTGPLTDRAQTRDDNHMLVRPGADMLVAPRLKGGRVNPPWARVQWVENFHRLEFRIAAAPDRKPGETGTLEGVVDFFAGPLLIGETPFSVNVAARPEAAEPATAKSMSFSRVLPGFAGEDEWMTAQFRAAAESVNMPFLDQILELRAGAKDRGIRRLVSRAERYQLCWSAVGSKSAKLRREWEEAMNQKKPGLIRICSWEQPMPAPPTELKDIPVQRLPAFGD